MTTTTPGRNDLVALLAGLLDAGLDRRLRLVSDGAALPDLPVWFAEQLAPDIELLLVAAFVVGARFERRGRGQEITEGVSTAIAMFTQPDGTEGATDDDVPKDLA
jgi:hypothetical protein